MQQQPVQQQVQQRQPAQTMVHRAPHRAVVTTEFGQQ